ncbi:MAG: type II toxin-antitoxin system VapC family toxin [Nostoc sp.]|uniref:type II toxin-antitoxin system VapC family toxin n=1 Tax=Nostoc sp. TaxID=1180 RepID=UPI002FFC204C
MFEDYTNHCDIYIRDKNITLKQKLESTATKDIAVCSIFKAELFYGVMKSANPERNLNLQQLLAFGHLLNFTLYHFPAGRYANVEASYNPTLYLRNSSRPSQPWSL